MSDAARRRGWFTTGHAPALIGTSCRSGPADAELPEGLVVHLCHQLLRGGVGCSLGSSWSGRVTVYDEKTRYVSVAFMCNLPRRQVPGERNDGHSSAACVGVGQVPHVRHQVIADVGVA